MAGCVLRIKGKDLNIPSSLEVLKVFEDGANIEVSDSEEFDVQLIDAVKFMKIHNRDIGSLTSQSGYKGGCLDFGVFEERKWSKSYGYSAELVVLAATHNLEIMVSVYASENT